MCGQAKSGGLPQVLTVEGTTAIHDPVPGDIYFWPTSDVVAVYYDDLGQTVPEPGLIRLGVIDTGLDSIAGAGRRFKVRIDVARRDRLVTYGLEPGHQSLSVYVYKESSSCVLSS
jgi:hypothetical protein